MKGVRSVQIGAMVLAGGVGVLLAGCTTGQVGVPPQATTSGTATFALKFAVGTATIAKTSGGSVVGFNVAATFRQANAQNAT
ncbi:MAG: hypothetical protein IAI50_13515, partial [Candidatus Eremiobacteraeota bacterium]|nr:hypothetical protein [Candidatus Eremiobacteraeota bacterium]